MNSFYYHVWVTLLRMVVRDNVQSRFLPSHGAFRCTARSTYTTKLAESVFSSVSCLLDGSKSLILLSLFRARTACAISKSVSRIKRGKRPCITKGSLKIIFFIPRSDLAVQVFSGDEVVRVLKYLRFVSGVIKHNGIEIRRIRTFAIIFFFPLHLRFQNCLQSSENQTVGFGGRSGRINQSQCFFPCFVIGLVPVLLLLILTTKYSLG